MSQLIATLLAAVLLLCHPTASLAAQAAAGAPVRIGLDGEFSIEGSTSAQAIELGIRVAIAEINAAGGVLGGRPLELLTRDNRTNPARGIANLREFTELPDMVAVFGGRFSPVVTEMVKPAHELKMILLAPWSSASSIIDNGFKPSYAFRLALYDAIAMPAMIERVRVGGRRKLGLMLANSSWGRSNRDAAEQYASKVPGVQIVGVEWHNTGETSLLRDYTQLIEKGAEAIVLVANDGEGAALVREVAALDAKLRVPIVAHWGVTGGTFHDRAGAANLARLDFSVIQTFSLFRLPPARLRSVMALADKQGGTARPEDIRSPVGFGHAYDLTQLLARAIKQAGTTDRAKVRDALETLGAYDGLVRRFARPFTPERHEALQASDLFFARYRDDGVLVPAERAGRRAAAAR